MAGRPRSEMNWGNTAVDRREDEFQPLVTFLKIRYNQYDFISQMMVFV